MLVNNDEFKLYNSDTEDTILVRLASLLKTTPYWLDIKSATGDLVNILDQNSDLIVVNLIADLKIFIRDDPNFLDVQSRYKRWLNSKEDGLKELATMYIVNYTDSDDMNTLILLEDQFRDPNGSDFDWDFIQNTLTNRDLILKRYLKDVELNKTKSDIKLKDLINQEGHTDVRKVIETTDFETQGVVTTLYVECEKPIILSYIFNSIEMDIALPNSLYCFKPLFVRYKNFYKICSSKYIKSYDFDLETDDGLHIVYYYQLTKTRTLFKEIKIISETENNFIVEIDTLEEDVETILHFSLPTAIIKSSEKTKARGVFFLKNTFFHKSLLLDEIMNNMKYSALYMNERKRVAKYYKLHLYFYTLSTNYVTFSLNNQNNDVLVQVSKINLKNIQNFIKQIADLFSLYKSREMLLFNIYKTYIPNIKLNDDIDELKDGDLITEKKLADIEPTLFVPLYSRRCAKQPRILEPDEITKFETMDFPVYEEGGLKPRKYVCDKTGSFQYPGLRKNKLSNSDIFKYIPCCFETNQKNRAAWNIYFNKADQDVQKYEHTMYKTARILPSESTGTLPTNITKLLPGSNRRGVYISPNSFIDCVARALGNKLYVEDQDKRNRYISSLRQKLIYELCCQENSDILNTFKTWFKNDNLYFEPRRFFRSLEYFFKTNIYIFEKSADHVVGYDQKLIFEKTYSNNGVLSIPNIPPNGLFIDPKNYSKTVYVYLHMGSSVDNIEFPHCEYIETDVSPTNVDSVYRRLLIMSRKDKMPDYINAKGQFLDNSGRCVRVITDKIIVFDKPTLPLPVPILKTEIKSEDSFLDEYIYKKRFARLFVEYCAIKLALSGESLYQFMENHTKVLPNFRYPIITPNYEIAYYDKIFTDNGKITFESKDTRNRIFYTLSLLDKRTNIYETYKRTYLINYFQDILDFNTDCLVLKDEAFKKYAFGRKPGYTMVDSLEPISTESVIIVNTDLPSISGFYKPGNNLKEILNTAHVFDSETTSCYVWENSFVRYGIKDSFGKTLVIYKINGVIYYLAKINNL